MILALFNGSRLPEGCYQWPFLLPLLHYTQSLDSRDMALTVYPSCGKGAQTVAHFPSRRLVIESPVLKLVLWSRVFTIWMGFCRLFSYESPS
jgi:hypothetical protein